MSVALASGRIQDPNLTAHQDEWHVLWHRLSALRVWGWGVGGLECLHLSSLPEGVKKVEYSGLICKFHIVMKGLHMSPTEIMKTFIIIKKKGTKFRNL